MLCSRIPLKAGFLDAPVGSTYKNRVKISNVAKRSIALSTTQTTHLIAHLNIGLGIFPTALSRFSGCANRIRTRSAIPASMERNVRRSSTA